MPWSFYDANGVRQGGVSGALANTALSNLAAVAINTSLISDSDSVDSFGSTALKWLAGFFDKVIFDETAAPGTPDAGDVALYALADGNLYAKDDAGLVRIVSQPDYILIRDEKSTGTQGGTFTSGAWRTRDLNTEVSDTGGHAALSSNQITLAAGTYIINASAPAYKTNNHKTKLVNTTDVADIIIGTAAVSGSADDADVRSVISGKFTIAAGKALEIQHQATTTAATNGFGLKAAFSEIEVYTQVELWKVD